MTSRVCTKHGVPEYCPDGVCRWCEVQVVDIPLAEQETAGAWLANWKPPEPAVDAIVNSLESPLFFWHGVPVVVDPTLKEDEFRMERLRGQFDDLLRKVTEHLFELIAKKEGWR